MWWNIDPDAIINAACRSYQAYQAIKRTGAFNAFSNDHLDPDDIDAWDAAVQADVVPEAMEVAPETPERNFVPGTPMNTPEDIVEHALRISEEEAADALNYLAQFASDSELGTDIPETPDSMTNENSDEEL